VITNATGTLGIGIKGAGVGASVTVNMIGGHTKAFIAGSDTKVTALGQGDGLEGLAAGGIGQVNLADTLDVDFENGVEDFDRPRLAELLQRETVRGVAVNAAATHSILNVVGTAGAGLVGIAGTAGVNVLRGSTEAYVDGASLNTSAADAAGQSVSVRAVDHAYNHAFVGTVSAGGGALGAGVNAATFERATRAYIQNSLAANAQGAVTVAATASQRSGALSAGFAAGAVAGVGTGNVSLFKGTAEAYVLNSSVESGGLTVQSDHAAELLVMAGGAAIGLAGAGATAAVAVNESASRARISGGTVRTEGDVAVEARNETVIDGWGASGSVGLAAGLAGAAVVTVTQNTTEALVANAAIGDDQWRAREVSVIARDRTTVAGRVGSAGLPGGAGVGVAVPVISANGSTAARISNAQVYAGDGGVRVQAVSDRDLRVAGGSLGAGFGGVAGTVAIILSGARIEGDTRNELNERGDVLTALSDLGEGDRLVADGDGRNVEPVEGLDASRIRELNDSLRFDAAQGLTEAVTASTSASMTSSSVVDAAGSVSVTADE